jgi:hypothetical protein
MLVRSIERAAHIKPPLIPAGSWLPRLGVGVLVNELTFPLSDWRLRPWATGNRHQDSLAGLEAV